MKHLKESTLYAIFIMMFVVCLVVLFGYDNKDNKEVNNNSLKSNQTELHYMYTDDNGSYLLDSNVSVENVIYVSHADMVNWIGGNYLDELEHGNKMVGTFRDDALWELVGLNY